MKRLFNKLIALCNGRFFVEFDTHKKFGEKVYQHIQDDEVGEFKALDQTTKDLMIANNSIIRVEAHPNHVMVSVIVYSHDLQDALKKAVAKIREAEKEEKKNG